VGCCLALCQAEKENSRGEHQKCWKYTCQAIPRLERKGGIVDPAKMQTPGQIFQCLLYIDLSFVKKKFLGAILQCNSKISALELLMLQNNT
jgi:hypothetical protein